MNSLVTVFRVRFLPLCDCFLVVFSVGYVVVIELEPGLPLGEGYNRGLEAGLDFLILLLRALSFLCLSSFSVTMLGDLAQ